jgi:hypothetical protein
VRNANFHPLEEILWSNTLLLSRTPGFRFPENLKLSMCLKTAMGGSSETWSWNVLKMSDETFWLAVANISLGVVTVACVVLFVKVMIDNVPRRMRGRAAAGTKADGKGQSDREHSSGQTGEAGGQTNG